MGCCRWRFSYFTDECIQINLIKLDLKNLKISWLQIWSLILCDGLHATEFLISDAILLRSTTPPFYVNFFFDVCCKSLFQDLFDTKSVKLPQIYDFSKAFKPTFESKQARRGRISMQKTYLSTEWEDIFILYKTLFPIFAVWRLESWSYLYLKRVEAIDSTHQIEFLVHVKSTFTRVWQITVESHRSLGTWVLSSCSPSHSVTCPVSSPKSVVLRPCHSACAPPWNGASAQEVSRTCGGHPHDWPFCPCAGQGQSRRTSWRRLVACGPLGTSRSKQKRFRSHFLFDKKRKLRSVFMPA